MKFSSYLTEKKKTITPLSLLASHDKIKNGKWRLRDKPMTRGEMGKVLNDLKNLRYDLLDFEKENREEGYYWKMRQRLPGHIRAVDQLLAYAKGSMKSYEVDNFFLQADRALLNLHNAIGDILGEK